mmetsp:Transcript_83684/g.270578  ORF Transcript_83684/g.270578 Transcript_83684/m.270578 type:complete len:274 (+) Transcript_83684:195-1016(+)
MLHRRPTLRVVPQHSHDHVVEQRPLVLALPVVHEALLQALRECNRVVALRGHAIVAHREDGDAQTEDVRLLVVATSIDFGGHEATRAHAAAQLLVGCQPHTHAEVREFQRGLRVCVRAKEVLGLDVSVDEAMVVQIEQAVQHLPSKLRSDLGRQAAVVRTLELLASQHILLDVFRKVFTRAQVEDEMVGAIFPEEGVQLQDVGVVELARIRDLCLDVLHVLVVGNRDGLECEALPDLLALHLIDLAVAPLSDHPAELVVLPDLLQEQGLRGLG